MKSYPARGRHSALTAPDLEHPKAGPHSEGHWTLAEEDVSGKISRGGRDLGHDMSYGRSQRTPGRAAYQHLKLIFEGIELRFSS